MVLALQMQAAGARSLASKPLKRQRGGSLLGSGEREWRAATANGPSHSERLYADMYATSRIMHSTSHSTCQPGKSRHQRRSGMQGIGFL